MYAIIDRREWKVIAKATRKSELPEVKGMLVDTKHLDRLGKGEIIALYEHIAHGEPVPVQIVEQLKKAIERNGTPVVTVNGELVSPETAVKIASMLAEEQQTAESISKSEKAAQRSDTQATATKKVFRSPTGPVARVWALFDKNKGLSRKEAVALAVKTGINEATASTQYSRWKKLQS